MTGPALPLRPEDDWSLGAGAGLARAHALSRGQAPEQAARVLDLSRRTGMTSAFVRDNLDALEQEAAGEDFDAAEFARSSPLVAQWLAADPNRVALLGKDLRRFNTTERIVRDIASKFRAGQTQVELTRIGSAVLQGTVTPEQRGRQQRLQTQLATIPDYGLEGFLQTAPGAAAQQLPIYTRSLVAGGVGAAGGAAVGGAIGGLLTKTPGGASAGARTGAKVGGAGALYLANAEMEAALAVLDYEQMTDANGRLLDPETARGAALIAGAIAGSLESVADITAAKLIPGVRTLVSDLLRNPTTRNVLAGYAKQVARTMATEGVTEAMQSTVTQVSGAIATGAQDGTVTLDTLREMVMDPATFGAAAVAGIAEVAPQALAEGVAGAQAAMILGGGAGAVSTGLDLKRIRDAEKAAIAIEELARTVNESEVTTAAPAEVESLVRELHQSGLSGFSYDARAFRDFWQTVTQEDGSTVDARQVVREVVGDAAEYEAALETGGAFTVPLDRWAARLTRQEAVRQWAVDNARVGPLALSRVEAKAAQVEIDAALESEVTAAPDAVRDLSTRLETQTRERLVAAGRSVKQSTADAALYASAFRAFATRPGQTPEAMFDTFGRVEIVGAEAAGVAGGLQQPGAVTQEEVDAFHADEVWEMREEQPTATLADIGAALSLPVRAVEQYLASPRPDISPSARRTMGLRIAFSQAAFHGSPHVFDRFTTAKMGTGEGAQAYGWGLYFAENEKVAMQYQPRDEGSEAKMLAAYNAAEKRGDFESMEVWERAMLHELPQDIRDFYNDPQNESSPALKQKAERIASQLAGFLKGSASALYRVDIPDAVVATFLDWDAEWAEMAPETQRVLLDAGIVEVEDGEARILGAETVAGAGAREFGAEVYVTLAQMHENQYGPEALVEIDTEDGKEGASKYLLSLGIRGIKFLDAGSRTSGEGTRNLVVFDEDDVTITHRNGEPVTPSERAQVLEQSQPNVPPRGRILLDPALEQVRIELLEKADESTFVHESAHFFLALMKRLAAESPEIKADLDALYAWVGAAPGDVLTVEQEEQFARGFEQYLKEGKSPSVELRGVFRQFAAWLTRLYRTLRSLNVTLTDDVRRIMDRMVAAEEEIAIAEQAVGPEPLFPEDAGIEKARIDATLAAQEQLRADLVDVVAREEKAWWKDRRKEVEAEVTADVTNDPAYRARTILQTGKLPDGTVPEGGDPLPQKLDKAAVLALVGEGRGTAYAKFYRVEGGVSPEVAAAIFGYENGAGLMDALGATISTKAHIKALTDRRMRDEYGDPLLDGSVAAKAAQAVHNTSRETLLRLQMEKMQELHPAQVRAAFRKFGGRVPSTAQMRERAKAMLDGRTIRSLTLINFERAEAKASREAIAAAVQGDWQAAADAKLREALSHALYREAMDALAVVEKSKARFAKAFAADDKIGKTRDLNYVNAARALTASVGYGRAAKTPDAYLESVKTYDPEAFVELSGILDMAPAPRDDLRDLTVGEMARVREMFDALWSRAKGDREIEVGGVKVQLDDAEQELVIQLETLPASKVSNARVEGMHAGWDALYSVGSLLARMESVVHVLDGGDFHGPFRQTYFAPASQAATRMREQMVGLYAQYLTIVQGLGDITEAPIPAPMLRTPDRSGKLVGYQWRGKSHLLGALLHVGNASNLDKLLRGMGWDRSEWDAMVAEYVRRGVLTEADLDAIQGIWSLFESVKPQAQQVFKRLYGHYFSEITAEPFTVSFPNGTTKTYVGGYVPALRDPDLVEDAAAREQARELETGITPEAMPSTGRGFTYRRTEAASPLLMDLRLVGSHLDAVMRFIHLEPVVRPLARLTRRPAFKESLDRVLPKGATRVFNPFLQRVASQRTTQRGVNEALDRAASRLRRGATGSFLFGNVANAVQNIVGLSTILTKVKPRYVLRAIANYAGSPKRAVKAATDASAWMRQHSHNKFLELQRDIRDRIEPPSAFQSMRDFTQAHGFVLSRMTQSAMDVVSWHAGYEQATADGASPEQAVERADSTVRTSQGVVNPEDVAPYQVTTPMGQLVTMMSSYFNGQANNLGAEAAVVVQAHGLRKSARRLFYLYVVGLAIPSVLGDAVVRVMNNEGIVDPDDEEPWLVDVFKFLALAQARYVAAMVPFVGPNAMAFVNAYNNKPYDDRITVSPATATVEAVVRGTTEIPKQLFTDEELSRRDIRDIFTAFSIYTDLPVGFLARPLQYQFDVNRGAAEPTGPVDYGRGLMTGRP